MLQIIAMIAKQSKYHHQQFPNISHFNFMIILPLNTGNAIRIIHYKNAWYEHEHHISANSSECNCVQLFVTFTSATSAAYPQLTV